MKFVVPFRASLLVATVTVLYASSLFAAGDIRNSFAELSGFKACVPACEESVVYSPFAYYSMLAILAEAADAETHGRIAEKMDVLAELAPFFSVTRDSYAVGLVSNRVSMAFAPSLWLKVARSVDRKYDKLIQNSFGAEVGVIGDTPLFMNSWTEVKTYGRVRDIVPEIDPHDDVIMLCGACFTAAWSEGSEVRLQKNDVSEWLALSIDAYEVERESFKFVALPLADEDVYLMMFVPAKGVSLAKVKDEVTGTMVFNEMKSLVRSGSGDGLKKGRLNIFMPRLNVTSSVECSKALGPFAVPDEGFTGYGVGKKPDRAIVKSVFALTDCVGSMSRKAPKKVDRLTRAIEASKGKVREEASARAEVIDTVNIRGSFVYMVWDRASDTLPFVGQFVADKD